MKPTFTFHIGAAMAVSALALTFVSCADEEFAQGAPLEGCIAFDPELGNGSDRASRSAAPDDPSGIESVRTTALEGGDTEMYVHMVTTGGIERSEAVEGDSVMDARSRAAAVNAATLQSFALFAYAYEPDNSARFDGIDRPNYIYNEQVTRSAGWRSTHSWPHGDMILQFGAFAPWNSRNVTVVDGKTNDGEGGMITLKYVTPSDLSKQEDFLVTRFMNLGEFRTLASQVSLTDAKINMRFDHALSAIAVKAAPDMLEGRVSNVTITDIIAEGTWELNRNYIDWTLDDSKLVTFSKDVDVRVGGGKEAVVIGGSDLVMVLPGSATRSSKLLVTYTDDLSGTERTLSADLFPEDLDESPYEAGKTYTYTISKNSVLVYPSLLVSGFDDSYYFTGGKSEIKVNSYATVYRSGDETKQVELPWEVEYSTDNGNTWTKSAPSWVTGIPVSGTGEPQTFTAAIARSTGKNTGSKYNDILKNGPAATAIEYDGSETQCETPLNESGYIRTFNLMDNGGRYMYEETANCYIVTGPGTFYFAAYFGNDRNMIDPYKTSHKMHDAYSGEGMVLESFVDHAGNQISHQTMMSCGSDEKISLKVLWSDAPGLISDTKCSYMRNQYGGGTIGCNFTVKRETIRQGNAVIGLFDADGQLRWSWHIWVTASELIDTPCEGPNDHAFMPVPLGWVDNHTVFEKRVVKVRFTQPYSGQKREIDIIQEGNEVTGHCPTYQFGRKDPMPAIDYVTKQQVPVYDCLTGFYPSIADAPVGYKERLIAGICHPSTFYTGTVTVNDQILRYDLLPYMNLWDNNADKFDLRSSWSSHYTTKTVYDPCPRGWSVPSAAWLANINGGYWDESRFGRYTVTHPEPSLYIPYVGIRLGDGQILQDDKVTYYSSTGTKSESVYIYTYDKKTIHKPGDLYVGSGSMGYRTGQVEGTGSSYPIIPGRDLDSSMTTK